MIPHTSMKIQVAEKKKHLRPFDWLISIIPIQSEWIIDCKNEMQYR